MRMRGRRWMQGTLLLVVLVAGVVLGIVGMHALDRHGTHSSGTGQAAVVHAEHASAPSVPAGDAVGQPDCADCGGGHSSMWMVCVLALIAAVVLLMRPVGWTSAPPIRARVAHLVESVVAVRARAPSLVVLCISRR